MKTSKWLVISLIMVFSFACTLPTGANPPTSPAGETPSVPLSPASQTPTFTPPASATPPPASDTPTPVTPQGGNVPASLDIPAQNDPAPAGILEQLSWGDMGGGMEQVCGNCNVVMSGNNISFFNFQPLQELKVFLYRRKEKNSCNYDTAEYVTTLSVQMDGTGNFSADLRGSTNDLAVVYILDANTGGKIWKSYSVPYEKFACSPSQGNQPVTVNIPSQNDPAPNGILEQLSWADVGGGESGPQVCGNCNVVMGGDRILISNFQPSQELKVVIYRHNECKQKSAKYVTTLSIQVDKAGNFSAGLSGPTQDLMVVSVLDGRTGEKIWTRPFNDYLKLNCPDSQNLSSCPGAPPQRLKVNQTAYVCTSKDSVKLREGAGKNFSTLKMLVPGADVTIVGGPTCADNWSWWQVKTTSGSTGWMSEGGDNTDPYFLCPKP